jgi:hypothetical protein
MPLCYKFKIYIIIFVLQERESNRKVADWNVLIFFYLFVYNVFNGGVGIAQSV